MGCAAQYKRCFSFIGQIGTSDGMCNPIQERLLVIHDPALLLRYAFFVFDPNILTFMMYSFGDLTIIFFDMIIQQQLRDRLISWVICFLSVPSYLGIPSDVYHSDPSQWLGR